MNLALFDFDNTLTTRDMMSDFMYAAVAPWRRRTLGLVVAPVVLGYKAGWVSGSALRRVAVDAGFRHESKARVDAAGERFAREVLSTVLRDSMMRRLRDHQRAGDTVAVVSGGLDVYLGHWCRANGVGHLLCSSLSHADGVLHGRFQGAQCVGAEKARRVRESFDLSAFDEIYAYGDSDEDRELLALAHRRFYRGRELAAA